MPIYLLILVVAAKILVSSLLTTIAVKTLKDRHINLFDYLPGRIEIDHIDGVYQAASQEGMEE